MQKTRLSDVPNLEQKIEALKQSEKFKDLGDALEKLNFEHNQIRKYTVFESAVSGLLIVMWSSFTVGLLNAVGLSWPIFAYVPALWLVLVFILYLVIGD